MNRPYTLSFIFLVLMPSVLLAQNTTTKAPAERSPAIENFPSRDVAQANWKKAQPAPVKSESEAGPNMNLSPGGGGGGGPGGSKISGSALPDPKIGAKADKVDYAGEALERVAPMSAQDILKFEDDLYERAKAMAQTPGGPYTLKGSRVVRVSFEPNAKPEMIDIAMNLGALVMFVDRSGSPLTIEGAKSFASAFDVSVLQTEEAKTKGSSTVEILPKTLVGHGNLMVRLAGVVNPLLMQVKVGQSKAVDSVVQVVVPVLTPSRTVLPGDRMAVDAGTLVSEMQGFLMGIPPEDAVEVKVRQVGSTSTWMWRNRLYVRTPHTIFSPGWFRRQAAVDGTAVYELPLTSVVRMGVDGREADAIFELPYIPPTFGAKQE